MNSGTMHMPTQPKVFPPETMTGQDSPELTAPHSRIKANNVANAFATILPTIQAALCRADRAVRADKTALPEAGTRPGTQIIETLSSNISQLQDSFMDALYEKLRTIGVDATNKLTLRLERTARLVISGDHPDKERINTLLADQTEFADAFAEIATQSAMLRDLRSLHTLAMYARAADSYMAMAAGNGDCLFQLSLKGEMNHFYFTR